MKTVKVTAIHLMLWSLSFLAALKLFSYNASPELIDFIYALLFHGSLLVVVYVNIWFLMTRILKRNVFAFAILAIALVFAASYFNIWIFSGAYRRLFPDFYFVVYYELQELLIIHSAYFLLSTLLILSTSYFRELEMKKQIIELRQKQSDMELNTLKAQINPHLLFNTLNNIFGLALRKDDRTADSILKLSDTMRYILYESGKEKIELEKEIEILNNYLEIEMLRLDDRSKVTIEISGEPAGIFISPLLLLPLVENCFKHAKKDSKGDFFIDIMLNISPEQIRLFTLNTIGSKEISGIRGIGLQNLKRRLDLSFPGKHSLQIEEKNERYLAILTLNPVL
jgi:sensor histidine kinase YesM